jgi:hypothetical protein
MEWLDFSHIELPKTILKISSIVYGFLTLVLSLIAMFTNLWVLPLWWSVGALIAIINYLTILFQTRLLQQTALAGGSKSFGGNLYVVRLTLSGLGLFLAAYLVQDANLKLLAIGAVFVAYLLNSFIILLVGNIVPKKSKT